MSAALPRLCGRTTSSSLSTESNFHHGVELDGGLSCFQPRDRSLAQMDAFAETAPG
jgi:hypothetical protein